MNNFFARFANDESGVTAMEYGMIAALVAVAILTILTTLGGDITATFTKISAAIEAANAG